MVLHDAPFVFVIVVFAISVAVHKVACRQIGAQVVPDLVDGHVLGLLLFPRSSSHEARGHSAETTSNVQVVALDLREGFLQDHGPQGFIFT